MCVCVWVGGQGLCASGCVGFDRLSARYSVTLPLGADGGALALAGAVDGAGAGAVGAAGLAQGGPAP